MTEAERQIYEANPIPLACYTYTDGKIVPLLVSDGFCALTGLEWEKALAWFQESQFERIHPDDVGRIYSVSEDFIRHTAKYDVIFRCMHEDGCHFIHAVGEWMPMPDGTELAEVVYVDMSESGVEMEKRGCCSSKTATAP